MSTNDEQQPGAKASGRAAGRRLAPKVGGGAGTARGASSPAGVAQPLSAKAQRLGLITAADVQHEFAEARQGWSRGTEYHCPFCDKDFTSSSGARKHMNTQGHPVLRWDWYD